MDGLTGVGARDTCVYKNGQCPNTNTYFFQWGFLKCTFLKTGSKILSYVLFLDFCNVTVTKTVTVTVTNKL